METEMLATNRTKRGEIGRFQVALVLCVLALMTNRARAWSLDMLEPAQLTTSFASPSVGPLTFPSVSSNAPESFPLFMSDTADAIAATQGDGDSAGALAKKLSNPVASLISVPLQNNFDFGGGPNHNGWRYLLNIQPVIPVSLSDNWNLIIRTILPVIYQNQLYDNHDEFGLGDMNQSFFFSPAKPTSGGLIWAVGPVFLFPTSTAQFLGAHRWGLGPTALVLVQQGPWTYGILANHIWSIGHQSTFNDEDGNPDVSNTFLQPFLSYGLGHGMTVALNTESTYDWKTSEWTVPINLSISQVIPIGGHPVSFALGARGYAAGPHGTPEWGLRFVVTFLFPEK
jgi:hypothetical protein